VNPDKPGEMNNLSTMNKIMEYMALGKPIVQFDLKEGRFSAQQSSLYARCGDVGDFADRIVELIDDPEQRARMGEYGRWRVINKLQWRHQVPQLLEAYARLWPTPGPSPRHHQDTPAA
jgi:glycosyltransferase involved in cell wall biosynthesis